MQKNKLFTSITFVTLFFCLAVTFDISPYLRGPAPYPPEWQWSYLFINTLSKIYLPIVLLLFVFGTFWLVEKKKFLFSKQFVLLLFLMLLFFLFQLSLLYFSRSGIPVLIHRIINPELNGYFTASLPIQNTSEFLKTYNDEMLGFVYHAKAHPPGAILLFYFVKQLIAPFSFLIEFINVFSPTHMDVQKIWNTLLPIEKTTAVVSAFFIPLLSAVSLIPLYFSAKFLYTPRVAIRSIFLFLLIPSLVFFIPINDAFLHLFSITAFFFLLRGLQKNQNFSLLLSGAILFLGIFFNLSLLPVLILFFVFALLFLHQKKNVRFNHYITGGTFFSLGFFLPAVSLNFFFHFNFLQVIQTIMKHVPDVHSRSYPLWLFFNLTDFLIFCGIPVALILLTTVNNALQQVLNKEWKKSDPLLVALFLMIIILNFSGSVRGETGRLWSPYIPFVVLLVTNFLTDRIKFSTKLFIGILLLQAIQILFMQEFWVMLW